MGNICRSLAAESVFRHLVDREGLCDETECDSAGTIDFHEGNALDSGIRRTGEVRGIDIEGRRDPSWRKTYAVMV
ncbi:MAG: Low molecular weight protein-tyrosine-phosphatase YfkJ [Verrucomicrobia subdivision 3 bacterium]|nr:Low molecular weight protein-tyrosine-phosphatase YfkJ [Limisphaerales bacterium]MCS1412934.1 Low molecular weight protein-tyrosine-phosphatase YfkJ [Limisphaerales bacterium]